MRKINGSVRKINGSEGLFIGPIPGVAASFYRYDFLNYRPTAVRLKEVVKPFRLDLGMVSESDLAEVASYEVKIVYK